MGCIQSLNVAETIGNKNKPVDDEHINGNLEQLKACTLANTSPSIYKFKKAKVIKVYDGDTLTIAAWYDNTFQQFQVRIYGIDCDEIRGGTDETKHNAQLAKTFAENLLLNEIVDINVLNNTILHGKKQTEKFGRLLAEICINGVSLATELLNVGLARKYTGGTKTFDKLTPNFAKFGVGLVDNIDVAVEVSMKKNKRGKK